MDRLEIRTSLSRAIVPVPDVRNDPLVMQHASPQTSLFLVTLITVSEVRGIVSQSHTRLIFGVDRRGILL